MRPSLVSAQVKASKPELERVPQMDWSSHLIGWQTQETAAGPKEAWQLLKGLQYLISA
jgi:hypothetical protein